MRKENAGEASRYGQQPSRSRRAVLGTLGAAAGIALAGCSGGGGDDGSTDDESGDDASGDDGANGDGSNGDGGGGDGSGGENGDSDGGGGGGDRSSGGTTPSGCPSPPFSYSEYTVSYPDQQYPAFAVDAPGFAQVVTAGGVSFNYQTDSGSYTTVSASHWETTSSVSDITESLAEQYEETTSEYDLQPDGARSFTFDRIGTTIVVYPTQSGASSVSLGFQGAADDCPDTVEALRTHMIESIRLA